MAAGRDDLIYMLGELYADHREQKRVIAAQDRAITDLEKKIQKLTPEGSDGNDGTEAS